MNPSILKHGLRSMKRLKRAVDGELAPSSKTTAVGNAVHAMVSGEFAERFVTMPAFEKDDENKTAGGKEPKAPKATKYYKEKVEAWLEDNKTKTVLNEAQLATAGKIVNEIHANGKAHRLIKNCSHEVTVIANIGGIQCKTRIDLVDASTFILSDIKTCPDVAPHAFYSHAKRMGYFFQFAFHVVAVASAPGGWQCQQYKCLAAEASGDYDTCVVNIPFALLDRWKDKVESVVESYRLAHASGSFPGLYPSGADELHVPNWDMGDDDDVEFEEHTKPDRPVEEAVYF